MKWDDLTIGPHRVEVIVFDLSDKDASGEAHISKNEIHLRKGMPPSQEVETLLHEVVHLLICAVPLGDTIDEIMAGVVGRGLTEFIKDNPATVRQLLKVLTTKEETDKCQPQKLRQPRPRKLRRKSR